MRVRAQVDSTEVVLAARCRRKYANAHTYHINSIALSSDQETFITADDLRVNLWHLDVSDQAFNVVDMKPANMEELTEARSARMPGAMPGHPPPPPHRSASMWCLQQRRQPSWPLCAEPVAWPRPPRQRALTRAVVLCWRAR